MNAVCYPTCLTTGEIFRISVPYFLSSVKSGTYYHLPQRACRRRNELTHQSEQCPVLHQRSSDAASCRHQQHLCHCGRRYHVYLKTKWLGFKPAALDSEIRKNSSFSSKSAAAGPSSHRKWVNSQLSSWNTNIVSLKDIDEKMWSQ